MRAVGRTIPHFFGKDVGSAISNRKPFELSSKKTCITALRIYRQYIIRQVFKQKLGIKWIFCMLAENIGGPVVIGNLFFIYLLLKWFPNILDA